MDVPLTEKRFFEFFKEYEDRLDVRFSGLESRMSGVESRLDKVEGTLKTVVGFQTHESNAIEFELEMLLKSHLKKKFPTKDIEEFEMKIIEDAFGAIITDLDAAFLIKPLRYRQDFSRIIHEEGNYPKLKNNLERHESYSFILAEAKHHMTPDRIKYKLQQFHKIKQLFEAAQNVLKKDEVAKTYSPKFIKTVERNSYLGKIDLSFLYFGAAFWDPVLLKKINQTIESYKNLVAEFKDASAEQKVVIYHKLCKLEQEWYAVLDPVLSDTKIVELSEIDSIYHFIDFIVPSGHRYNILSYMDPEPDGFIFRGGGGKRKTRKIL